MLDLCDDKIGAEGAQYLAQALNNKCEKLGFKSECYVYFKK